MNYYSIIIPAWNEENYIKEVLASLAKNRSAEIDFEIILVDNLSNDDTVLLAKKFGAVVLENKTGKPMTIAALRNCGARAAKGDILAFLDADMIVTPDWLSTASTRLNQGLKGAIGFVESVPEDAGWVAQVWGRRALLTCQYESSTDFLPGRNLIVSRDVFDEVQGFDEQLTTNEDKDFTFRISTAGYSVLLLPYPVLLHQGNEKGLKEFIRKEFWRQSSTLEYARKHNFTQRTLRSPLMSAGHLLMAAGCFTSVVAGYFVPALCILCAWTTPSAVITLKSRKADIRLYRFLLFLLTFLRWNVAGIALLTQIIRKKGFRRS